MGGLVSGAVRAAPATRPATNPKLVSRDKQIGEAIADLDSADGGAREKATLKLINIGPRVLKQLKEAMREDSTPEFAARAKGILEEIGREWGCVEGRGGRVGGGLEAIHGGKTEAVVGRP